VPEESRYFDSWGGAHDVLRRERIAARSDERLLVSASPLASPRSPVRGLPPYGGPSHVREGSLDAAAFHPQAAHAVFAPTRPHPIRAGAFRPARSHVGVAVSAADVADREVGAIVPELSRPGLRSCPRPPLSTGRASDERVSKSELESLLRASGLGARGQGRETARALACDEKTLRRWRDPRCQADLAPADIRIILQGRALTVARFSRTG
jgi:hypothetical protein